MSERQVICSDLQVRLSPLEDGNRIKVIIGTSSAEDFRGVKRFLGLGGVDYAKNESMGVAYADLTREQIHKLSRESYVSFIEGEVANGAEPK